MPGLQDTNYKFITPEQKQHFLEHGWLHLPQGVKKENIDRFVGDVWIRTGYDPNDSTTWDEEWFRMPRQKEMLWQDFAPKGWGAICEILGGEERIDNTIFDKAGDSLIANFGKEEYKDKVILPKDLGNWHVDGNWFTHFLDSGDQSLLIVILFNDVAPRSGGTWICEDGLTRVIKWLHDRPQGCPQKLRDPDGKTAFDPIITGECNKFVECVGKAGDMFICHGFMPHSASKNHNRIPRFITSPKIILKEPMNLNRENPDNYSLLELKTLRDLGVDSLPNWKSTGERQRFVPSNNIKKDGRLLVELERLKEHARKTGGIVDSIHVDGVAEYNGWREDRKQAPTIPAH
ncbi:hypothetical protein VKT23_009922 [Stygiomarasmius scandens]|uniref:Phytanoyl-CoA dioxygenase n=1 Tax=Marasmiellus scandens TaxID=2682957 RepID=A0ABR1JD60_9AGAR